VWDHSSGAEIPYHIIVSKTLLFEWWSTPFE
jgi:hypothetical protein